MISGHLVGCDKEKLKKKCPIVVQVIANQKEKETNREVVNEHLIGTSTVKTRRSYAVFIEGRHIWSIVPWFILINCLAQIGLYVNTNEFIYQHLIFSPELKEQFWRFFTYTLLHSDQTHLLLNVCLQWLIGFSLELEQGHWKVGLIYIAGGVSGSLATYVFQPQLSLLGASAGVYSLLMSHVPHLMKNFAQLPYRYFRIVALIVLCLSDAIFTAFHFLVNHNVSPRICLDAHIAGGVTGFLLGFVVYRGSGAKYLNSVNMLQYDI